MDVFLRKVGSEFDPAFVKLHVGTDDLDELVEFTYDRNDLSPLVDAGLKPLLRNKLYRAIVEEQMARANRSAAIDTEIDTDTDTEIHSDAASLSEASLASTSQVVSNFDVRSAVDPGNDNATTPRGSQAMVPESGFQGNCCLCGQFGHKTNECPNAVLVVDDAVFPPLGSKGPRRPRPAVDPLPPPPPPPAPAGLGRRPRPSAPAASRSQGLLADGFKQSNRAADQGQCPCCVGPAGWC